MDYVTHPTFGIGVILSRRISGSGMRVVDVHFPHTDCTRVISANFVQPFTGDNPPAISERAIARARKQLRGTATRKPVIDHTNAGEYQPDTDLQEEIQADFASTI